MKSLYKTSLLLFSMILASALFVSCEWDTSPEPEHPLYITYTVSASTSDLIEPLELQQDISAWIKANQKVYDKQVNYSTGEASEFAKTDAEAVAAYETFLPSFTAYLDQVKAKLAAGDYGEITTPIRVTFEVFAKRTQGEGGNLKYNQISFAYPQ